MKGIENACRMGIGNLFDRLRLMDPWNIGKAI